MTHLDTPWPPVNDMIDLRPGSVTTVASLPTAGRSTLTLNMAIHNALKGHTVLYSSSEINESSLTEKIVSAIYGVDLRYREIPLGGWDSFSARTKQGLAAMSFYLHSPQQETVTDAFTAGTVTSRAQGKRVNLWVLDSLAHFSPIVRGGDDVWDFDSAMNQLRDIAEREQLAVVVTASADNAAENAPLTLPDTVVSLSDQVLLLHREGAYWKNGPASNTAIVTRLKPGLQDEAKLHFQPRLCRFSYREIDA